MVLMRDPDNLISPSRPSTFYVSRDYGNTYANVTGNLTLDNGQLATISSFFSSKADNRKYILVAKFHRVIFYSLDECQTFNKVSTYFYPSAVKYHPRRSYYVAIHEEEMGSKRVIFYFIQRVTSELIHLFVLLCGPAELNLKSIRYTYKYIVWHVFSIMYIFINVKSFLF